MSYFCDGISKNYVLTIKRLYDFYALDFLINTSYLNLFFMRLDFSSFTIALFTGFLFLLQLGCSRTDDPIDLIPEEDSYVGDYKIFFFNTETEEINQSCLTAHFKASDGTLFTRKINHSKLNGSSRFELLQGLKEGKYRLLYFTYVSSSRQSDASEIFGMGNLLNVTSEGIENISKYNKDLGFFGSGTSEDPFIISCDFHLFLLQRTVNDENGRRKYLLPDACFRQVADIDMERVDYYSDSRYGWIPIGSKVTMPFEGVYDGNGFSVTNLRIIREETVGVGLFGFVRNGVIRNMKIVNAEVNGFSGVAALVGSVITSGSTHDASVVKNCIIEDSKITSLDRGYGTSGVVGILDSRAILWLDSCKISGTTNIIGSYGTGGMLGAGHKGSFVQATYCKNEGLGIEGRYTGAGGVIGISDTLLAYACVNRVPVKGASAMMSERGALGTGGIVGGSGPGVLAMCENYAQISGMTGVGGIIGSTRLASEPYPVYNSLIIQTSLNKGDVVGTQSVGGITGEAQMEGFALQNDGRIEGQSFVGGIIGEMPGGSLLRSFNNGKIAAQSSCGGIAGKSEFGSFAICQNFANLGAHGDYVGGILGRGGASTMIHYCANFGNVDNDKSAAYTGGIVGMLGDVKEWDPSDYVYLVVGTVNIFLGGIPICPVSFVNNMLNVISYGNKVLTFGAFVYNVVDYFLTDIIYKVPDRFDGHYDHFEEQIQSECQAGYRIISDNADRLMASHHLNGMSSGLRKDAISTDYRRYCSNVADYVSSEVADYQNSNEFIENMNNKRIARAEEIESIENIKSVTHSVITGVSVAVGTVTAVVSMCATGGGAAAGIALIVGAASTLLGGVNTVVGVIDDFETNSAIISQCVNVGSVFAAGENTGGVAGKVAEHCLISDCLNAGENPSGNGYSFATMLSSAEIVNCLNADDSWKANIYHVDENFSPETCYSVLQIGGVTNVSLEEMSQKSTFLGWSFTGKELWRISEETKGNFPIPYKSEMY